jgi:UDP-N-acetylmuramoyl-tripeptide--D-alanyl-D-alanine ligase
MAELGPDGPGYHAEIGRLLAELQVDVLYAVGPLAERYLEAGLEQMSWSPSVEDVRPELEPGDCVLVKASRAMGFESIVESLATVRG